MSLAWVLNLDADLELAHGSGYERSQKVSALVHALAPRARRLLSGGDVLLWPSDRPTRPAGQRGAAWCVTPTALDVFRDAGVEPPPAPSFECVRRVSSRRFSAELGQTLSNASFHSDTDSILARLAATSQAWRLKRAYSVAGRGQRRLRGEPTDDDLAWIRASMPHGIQLEPELDIVDELSIHGWIDEGSRGHEICEPMYVAYDAHGAFINTNEKTVAPDVATALITEAEQVAEALRSAGYFGPFGVDAILYRDGSLTRLNPRSEINPRFTMTFPADRFRNQLLTS